MQASSSLERLGLCKSHYLLIGFVLLTPLITLNCFQLPTYLSDAGLLGKLSAGRQLFCGFPLNRVERIA